MTKQLICPQCSGKIRKVTQATNSPLNSDQFDAVKAGDWYCPVCPGNNRGNLDLCYFWTHELLDSDEYHI